PSAGVQTAPAQRRGRADSRVSEQHRKRPRTLLRLPLRLRTWRHATSCDADHLFGEPVGDPVASPRAVAWLRAPPGRGAVHSSLFYVFGWAPVGSLAPA